MKGYKNVKHFFRRLLLFLILCGAILGGAIVYRQMRNQEPVTYTVLAAAALPTAELTGDSGQTSTLHGYTDEMKVSTMRQEILPLADRRQLSIALNPRGLAIDQVIYQLRSTDGSRLIDDGVMDKWTTEADGVMRQELQLANLMDDGVEYMLVLILKSGEQQIHYYSRVIYFQEGNGNTARMLDFIHQFSAATYSEDPSMIVNYLQPNDTMGTDDLSYINIHSRYRMFTWEGLQVQVTGEVRTKIRELSDSQMTAALYYPVTLGNGEQSISAEVEESFVVRFRSDTMYLLDYDRYVTQDFSVDAMDLSGGNIQLGMTAKKSESAVSPDGKISAFVYQQQLWIFDSAESRMVSVFTYQDQNDSQNSQDSYTIEIVRTGNDGTVDFVVSGYHSRGAHEGRVGACFYRYIKAENRMDELFFVPSDQEETRFCEQMGGLAYVSDSQLLYFLYGNTMYSVDLTSQEKMELATQSSGGRFYRNADENLTAWQDQAGQAQQITVMNLDSGRLFRIQAQEGEFLQIQGFVGTDLVYGVGKNSDTGMLSGTSEISPLYCLRFVSAGEELTENGTYESNGYVILSTELKENSVEIIRASKNGSAYEPAGNDQVFLNDRKAETTVGLMKSRQDAVFFKLWCISLGLGDKEVTTVSDPCRYEENDSSYVLAVESSIEEQYHAYGMHGLIGSEVSVSDAIREAYEEMGCVVDDSMAYLWTRRTRDLYKTLAVDSQTCESDSLSLETALDLLIAFEGGNQTCGERIAAGESPAAIAQESLSDRQVFDLTGCSVAQVLYYVSLGHPVLARTGEHTAVLITGYETKGITIYNPYGGETTQMTMADAEAWFAGLDDRFISCLKR